MALSPGGVVVILLMPLVGTLVSRVDPRFLVAFGFLVMSGSLFYMARKLNLQMDFLTAVELRCFQAAGLAFLFVPIQTLSYSGVAPQKNNQVSGIMNLSRNMGGDIGIAFVTTFIARRAQSHQANLSAHTTGYDAPFQAALAAMARAMEHAGSSSIDAARQATASIVPAARRPSTQLAYWTRCGSSGSPPRSWRRWYFWPGDPGAARRRRRTERGRGSWDPLRGSRARVPPTRGTDGQRGATTPPPPPSPAAARSPSGSSRDASRDREPRPP